MFYYISLGSNIHPSNNIAACIENLLDIFRMMYIFPCVYTAPEKIKSSNVFINTLIVISSDLSKSEVKVIFESLESFLGRDLSDPNKGRKDRVCDIDILTLSDKFDISRFSCYHENYVKEVLIHNNNTTQAKIIVFGNELPNKPVTLSLDKSSRLIYDFSTDFGAFVEKNKSFLENIILSQIRYKR